MTDDLKSLVSALVAPDAEAHGIELFEVEIAGARHAPVVRVYLDKPGGIGMEDISQATRRVSALLDEADVVPGRYTLEVSSPGIDRPLRDLDDVAAYEGEKAQVTLAAAVAGRKRFTGTIARVTDGAFVLDVEDAGEVEVPWSTVQKAQLKSEIDLNACADDNRISEERTASR